MASFEQILSKQSIFRDRNVLSPHYIPEVLPFREQQINEIKESISPALKSQKPRNIFIYGKTGTGKTCSVKRVLEEFEKYGSNAIGLYLNCRIYSSRYRVLQKILKGFIPELEKAGFGLPFLYEKLLSLLNSGKHLIIVLDEIDMVKDLDDLIYTLTRANDEIKNGSLTIIGISNKLSFKNELDPRSRSSLYETEMIFPPYTANQLQSILKQRVDLAFIPGAVEPSAVNLTAAIAAQETGDARYALKILEKAGEIAQQAGRVRIVDEDVESARKKVDIDIAAETINTLPENHQIVLYSIARLAVDGGSYSRLEGDTPRPEADFLFSGEIYEQYERICRQLRKKPRSVRWYREYLNDLEMLGLITTAPSGKGIRGQTTLIKIGHAPKDVLELIARNLHIGE